MRRNRTTLLTGLLLALLLLLTSLSTLNNPGVALAAPIPAATHSTSSSFSKIVHASGKKYSVENVTTVRTWRTKAGKYASDVHYVAKVHNRAGKVIYTRKVFDTDGWFQLLGKWMIKAPHYASFKALKGAIVAAT